MAFVHSSQLQLMEMMLKRLVGGGGACDCLLACCWCI